MPHKYLTAHINLETFLISNFRRVLNVVSFLHTYPPLKMEQTECSETLVYNIELP